MFGPDNKGGRGLLMVSEGEGGPHASGEAKWGIVLLLHAFCWGPLDCFCLLLVSPEERRAGDS